MGGGCRFMVQEEAKNYTTIKETTIVILSRNWQDKIKKGNVLAFLMQADACGCKLENFKGLCYIEMNIEASH
jgi:hypothetical protein